MNVVTEAMYDALVALHDYTNLRKATVYLSPTCVIKASRQRPIDRRDRRETFVVTAGIPNYAERAFIKLCKEAKEPFPLTKVQFKFWPKKKK